MGYYKELHIASLNAERETNGYFAHNDCNDVQLISFGSIVCMDWHNTKDGWPYQTDYAAEQVPFIAGGI